MPNQSMASYLDLTFTIEKDGTLSIKLYDKHDDFDFQTANIPFLSSNIPSDCWYGVYVLQLIRYARSCSHYDDFRHHKKILVERLVSWGYQHERLKNSFKTFYGRYEDLIVKYQWSLLDIVSDSFPSDTF